MYLKILKDTSFPEKYLAQYFKYNLAIYYHHNNLLQEA